MENGKSVYNTNQENALKTYLQTNFSGSIIFERYLDEKENKEEEGRVIGVYRTYSVLDMLQINEMLAKGAVIGKPDLQVFFTLYG